MQRTKWRCTYFDFMFRFRNTYDFTTDSKTHYHSSYMQFGGYTKDSLKIYVIFLNFALHIHQDQTMFDPILNTLYGC